MKVVEPGDELLPFRLLHLQLVENLQNLVKVVVDLALCCFVELNGVTLAALALPNPQHGAVVHHVFIEIQIGVVADVLDGRHFTFKFGLQAQRRDRPENLGDIGNMDNIGPFVLARVLESNVTLLPKVLFQDKEGVFRVVGQSSNGSGPKSAIESLVFVLLNVILPSTGKGSKRGPDERSHIRDQALNALGAVGREK